MSKESAQKISSFVQLLGMRFIVLEAGRSRCELEVVDSLLNVNRLVHGGVIYSLADTGMGAALYTDLAEGKNCTTIEIKISYFKPVSSGKIICETKMINRGRKIATLESEVTNNGQLIAKAIGTFYILSPR